MLDATRDFNQHRAAISRDLCLGIRPCLRKARSSTVARRVWACSRQGGALLRADGLKVPQIGWNQLRIAREDCPIFRDIPTGSYTYFVHSFYPQPVECFDRGTENGLRRDFRLRDLARQCLRDPVSSREKSQQVGLQVLKNFIALNRDTPLVRGRERLLNCWVEQAILDCFSG